MRRDEYCLTKRDIACLEHLCGHSLPDELKRYLLKEYGPGSYYEELKTWATETIAACSRPDDCWSASQGHCDACAFEATDTLLERVIRTIYCFKQGQFDISSERYSDAEAALGLQLSFADECTDWVC